jgi:hypothetical protein
MNEIQDLDIRDAFESVDRSVEICPERVATVVLAKKQRRRVLVNRSIVVCAGLAVCFFVGSFFSSHANNNGEFESEVNVASMMPAVSENLDEFTSVSFGPEDELVQLRHRLEEVKKELKGLKVQRQKQMVSLVQEKLSREEFELPEIDIVGF